MTAEGIVLVTGGSRGIGAATATLLAEQGRRVVIVDIAPEALPGTQAILWPDAFDVASRLSFGLWDSPPDRALWEAAASGQLKDRAQVTRQAERLVKMGVQYLVVDDPASIAHLRGQATGYPQVNYTQKAG